MNEILTIVGSSARAAAASAVRAGYQVRAGDLFADADLCRLGEITRVRDYPAGLRAVVGGPQPGAWMYTGALENHPPLVAAMARLRPLWGNSAAVLRGVRDPRRVAEAFQRHGLGCPEVACAPGAVPRDGRWLSKPRRSAGGARIHFWSEPAPATPRPGVCYFQQHVEGTPTSAVYVAAGGRSVLVGITRQLIAEPWTGADGFRYCGSIGPLRLPDAETRQFAAIGDVLAREFNLVGLFGVDAVVNAAGIWPVEVNPRYPASTEVLERSGGLRAIAIHAAACRDHQLPLCHEPARDSLWGKAILFARERLTVSAAWVDEAFRSNHERSEWADIPAAGSVIESNCPVVTIFASGETESAVLDQLRRKAGGAMGLISEAPG